MPLTWKDRIKVASATTGTGTLTLGAAASGYRTFAAGDDGKLFAYVIEDGTAWETGYGVYTHSGTTFARTTRTDSSTGSAISCTGAEFLFVDWIAGVAQDDIYALDAIPVAVSGATTATLGKWHVVTATSADYTITLPAGSSAGPSDCLGFIFTEAMTKLVTLDGNSTETINGETTRVQHDGEVAILRWDGSEWVKIGGHSIPMSCILTRTTDQGGLSSGAWNAVLMTAQAEGTPQMWDSGNNRCAIVRKGRYTAVTGVYVSGVSTSGYFGVGVNQTAPVGNAQQFFAVATAHQGFGRITRDGVLLNAGDFLVPAAYGDGSPVVGGATNPATLAVWEIPIW